jgi:cardiolipin-specific phospholipase
VESLEAWRKAHNIPKMTLAAHSMGGYMSVAYCEKYPERVERLILISPAGVPDDEHIDVKKRFQSASLGIRAMFKVAHSLFEFGVTPAAFLRNLPESRGRGMVARYIQGRLPAITNEEEQKFLGEYLYTNAALPASGEDCLKNVLKPTAFARVPTLHRIPRLKVKHVSFIYGQTDWMDPTGGIEVMEKVEQLDKNSDHSPPTVEVYGVKNAGHLLMLENWKEFNSAMVIAMGRRHALPTKAPLPYKVLDTGSSSNGLFFMKPRWEKKEDESQEDDQNQHANQGTPSMQG